MSDNNEILEENENDPGVCAEQIYSDTARKSSKKPPIPIIAGVAAVLLAAGAIATALYIKNKPSTERVNLFDYYGVSADADEAIIYYNGNKVADYTAYIYGNLTTDGSIYFSNAFCKEYLCDKFYYDEDTLSLFYTVAEEIIIYEPGSGEWFIDADTHELYISEALVESCSDITVDINASPAIVSLHTSDITYDLVTFNEGEFVVRESDSVKSKILADVSEYDRWYTLDKEDYNGFAKVANLFGLVGYVPNKAIGSDSEVLAFENDFEPVYYSDLVRDHQIILAWHGVYVEEDNDKIADLIAEADTLNVISPTWYYLTDAEADMHSFASKEYVDYAHEQGLEVWPLVSDFESGNNELDAPILASSVLRGTMIDYLMSEAEEYGYDGYNIDFEKVQAKSGDDYVQFIRELSIACRKAGIVLSVDNYVPRDHTEHYGRKQQGECVDYVIVMGYDEHWAGCETAGSTASLGFVEEGIDLTLETVPARKLINGIPFYTRLWKEAPDEEGNIVLSSVAYAMKACHQAAEDLGLTWVWDEELCQNVAQGEVDGVFYSIWLEDHDSMAVRMNMIKTKNIAGVAAWSLGNESSDIWSLLEF